MPHLTVTHTLTRAKGGVAGANMLSGRVSIEMLKSLNFPEPSEDTMILMCGPKAFTEAIKEFLLTAGYTENMMFP